MPPHPPFTSKPDPDAALLDKTRAQYEAGEITVLEAARALGFSRQTLTHRIAHKWFWRVPKRLAATQACSSLRQAAKIKAPRAPKGQPQKPIPKSELSPKALHRRLMVEIARLMRAIEALVDENGLPSDPERHAKMMGLVVKLQSDAVRLDELIKPPVKERSRDAAADAAHSDDTATAVDLARLRSDLAQKLASGVEPGVADNISDKIE
jgi:hypothetical protein